jgi:hypothetical protein
MPVSGASGGHHRRPHPVAPAPLHLVERRVRAGDDVGGGCRRRSGRGGDANAGGDHLQQRRVVAHGDRLDRPARALGDADAVEQVGARQHHDELLAAEARHQLVAAAHLRARDLADAAQAVVAGEARRDRLRGIA